MIEVLMIMTYETCKGAVVFHAGHRGKGTLEEMFCLVLLGYQICCQFMMGSQRF